MTGLTIKSNNRLIGFGDGIDVVLTIVLLILAAFVLGYVIGAKLI